MSIRPNKKERTAPECRVSKTSGGVIGAAVFIFTSRLPLVPVTWRPALHGTTTSPEVVLVFIVLVTAAIALVVIVDSAVDILFTVIVVVDAVVSVVVSQAVVIGVVIDAAGRPGGGRGD